MKELSPRDFAAGWIAAWNAHDIAAILCHYAEDIEFISPIARALVGTERVRGLVDLRAYWARGLSLNSALHFDLLDVLRGDGFLTLLYTNDRKQLVAETFEFDASGRVIRACACYGEAGGPSAAIGPHSQVTR